MAITQRDRRRLYDRLEAQLGPDEAATLMELLPDRPADELVTTTQLQTEMGLLRTDFRADMAELRTELKGEMAELRIELKGDVLRVENSLTLRIANLHTSMNRWVIGLATANVLGMVTALVT